MGFRRYCSTAHNKAWYMDVTIIVSLKQDVPDTFYYKAIDIWIMMMIVFDVAIFAFHIFLDEWIKRQKNHRDHARKAGLTILVANKDGPIGLKRKAKVDRAENDKTIEDAAKSINSVAYMIATIFFVGFNAIYWTSALTFYYSTPHFEGGIMINKSVNTGVYDFY